VTLPIAHFADWYESLLYLVPIVVVVAILWALGRAPGDEDTEPEA
jgi:hypothetical protein